MVKCPNCGIEYSLGRKIYHRCEGFSIYHGSVCQEPRKRYPWNCNDVIKKIKSSIDDTTPKIKQSYIEVVQSD